MSSCSIENSRDFNEPSELGYTDIDQIIGVMVSIDTLISNSRKRINDIEIKLATKGSEQSIHQDGNARDVNIGLDAIQLQSEKCGLISGISRLRENTTQLLSQARRIARINAEQFEKYKGIVLKAIKDIASMRRGIARPSEIVSYNDEDTKPYIDIFVNSLDPYTDFLNISREELINAISDPNALTRLYVQIKSKRYE